MTKTDEALKLLPCPFCGGPAEMDTRQGYINLSNGRTETAVAVYCTVCGVQASICRGDVPDVWPEEVAEIWNRREDGDLREHLKSAFVAGCCAVLTWTHSGMPQDDLDEAGYDYATAVLS